MNFSPQDEKSAASVARWAAVAIVLVALLLGSLLPGGVPLIPKGGISLPVGIVLDPGAISPPLKHLLVFGLLGFFLVLALKPGWRRAMVVAGVLAVLGLGVELAQLFIPERSFLWVDAGASAVGAVGGVVMGVFARWFVKG